MEVHSRSKTGRRFCRGAKKKEENFANIRCTNLKAHTAACKLD